MRCPNTDCGFEVEESFKFCPECGTKMEQQKLKVVICKNLSEDGSTCKSEIKITQKFCYGCGMEVDEQMFERQVMLCPSCKSELIPDVPFCSECGKRVLQKDNTSGSSQSTETTNLVHKQTIGPHGDSRETTAKEITIVRQTKEEPSLQIVKNQNQGSVESIATQDCTDLDKVSVSQSQSSLNTEKILATDRGAAFLRGKGDKLKIQTEPIDTVLPLNSTEAKRQMIVDSEVASSDGSSAQFPVELVTHNDSEESVAVDKHTNLFKDSGVDTDVSQQSAAPNLNHSEESDMVSSATSDGTDLSNKPDNVTVNNDDGAEAAVSTGIEKELENVTLEHRSPAQPNIQEQDTESDEGDFSTDESSSIEQPAESMGGEPASNGKKRKKKTKKKTYKTKRERKREKLKQTKDDLNSKKVIIPTVEQEDKMIVDQIQYGGTDSHALKETAQKGQNSGQQQNAGTSRTSSADIPLDAASNDKFLSESTFKPKEMVFGECSDKNKDTSTGFIVKVPPSPGSLFELDPKQKKESENQANPSEMLSKTKQSNTAMDKKENAKKPVDAHTSSMMTRNQAKGKQNNKNNKVKSGNQPAGKPGGQKPTGATGHTGERMVCVHFIALVSQEFKINPKTDKVYVRGNLDVAHGWKNKTHEMKFTGKDWKGNIEVEYKCNIPYSHLSRGVGLDYKYVIVKNKDHENKELWDFYMKKGKTGERCDRTLNIPAEMKASVPDVLQKFDGIINREPESQGFVERVKGAVQDLLSWKSGKLKKDCEEFVEFYCKHYLTFDNPDTLKENSDKTSLLIYQLKKIYQIDGECWTESAFKVEIVNYIMKWMTDYLVTCHQTKDRQTSLIIALTVVSLVKGNSLNKIELSDSQQNILCKALLIQPNEDGKTCFEVDFISKHYNSKQRSIIKEGILQTLKSFAYGKVKDPSWLFLTPLLHCLRDECKPYELPRSADGHQDKKPVWWGIAEFENLVSDFQNNYRTWSIPLKDVIELLQPLFKVDYFLPRTFMACLNLKEVIDVIKSGIIPVDVCCATLNYWMKVSVLWYSSYLTQQAEQMVLTGLQSLIDCIQSEQILSTEETVLHLHLSCKIADDMYTNSLGMGRAITQSLCMLLFLYCIDSFNSARRSFLSCVEKDVVISKSIKSIQDVDTTEVIQRKLRETQDWLRTNCSYWYSQPMLYLNIWNSMVLSDKFLKKETIDIWNGALGTALERQMNSYLSNESPEGFIQVYFNRVDSYKDCVQEVMTKVVIKVIEGGYKFDFRRFREKERQRFGHLLSDMFVKYWERTMKASREPIAETVLKLVLGWAPFTSFLQVLSKYQEDIKRGNLLSEACTEKLVVAVSVVEARCTELNMGSISVNRLRDLQKEEEKFVAVVDLMKNTNFSGALVSKLIKLRSKEVLEVEQKASLVTTLTSVCHFLRGVNLSKQDAALAKTAEIGTHCVKDFCKPLDICNIEDVEACQPNLTAFSLSPEVHQILKPLHDACKSTTFMKLWEKQCKDQAENCTSLEDVADNVWKPVNERWHTIAGDIASGDILFTQLELHVGKTYKDDYDGMKGELVVMGIKEKIVDRRLKQLKQYRQLETSVKGAKVILKFAQSYHLNGDFQQIRKIASHENAEMKMKDFDQSLMETCKILMDITNKESHCLYALVKSEPLIKWLKESMKKDGLKELKVFVDLALISAGEQPLDIDRVQGLNTAVLGYSPLIFDLNPDADYEEVLRKCKLVWKNLENNPKLPDKLVDSNRHLEWLKTIQKAHGSVEVSSLAQAEAINSNSLFSCGYIRNIQDDDILVPAKVLKLCVRSNDPNESRNYTHDQLQDLQSRLMLVAGRAEKEKSQGKDEVETFTEVFDGMKRLSSVYIKLHDAGCVLFKTWQATFICNPNIPVCAILDFGQGVEKLKGRRTEEEDTGFIIHKLARFLEVCLDDWLDYINEKRSKYLHLNYFTVDQLVQLQRELVKIGSEENPSVMIYPLLSAVKKDCTPADLNKAMHQAHRELNQVDEETAEETAEEMEEEESEDKLRETFIEEMKTAGFERHVALRALEVVQPDQIDEGLVWCMQHDSDSDNKMESETLADKNKSAVNRDANKVELTVRWPHSDQTVLSVASSYFRGLMDAQRQVGVGPLIKSLEELWKTFIGSISSNLQDHLSLEHLGLILRYLSQQCVTHIDRPFMAGFKSGVPNLVIVPAGDVINTVLTIYMVESSQPLPQSDEVLMCNSETTLDEVDIFWRRAIFDGGRKIHCLVNADVLDFDVSDRAEKLLEGYIQQTNHKAPDYRLVVICGSENEYRSRIVAALDKYRRPALPINVYNISQYLNEKLRVAKTGLGAVPAALVDFDNCSVRVIKSWRAGVGKTLYKKRRERELGQKTGRQEHYSVTVPLQEKKINLDAFIKVLLRHTREPGAPVSRIFHLDISHEVQDGADFLLFNLLVLGCLTDKTGHVWRRSELDLYLVENMPLLKTAAARGKDVQYLHSILSILPSMTCHSPRESLEVLSGETIEGYKPEDQLFDRDMFAGPVFQRTFQYLLRLDTGRQLQDINPAQVEGTEKDCLKVLLRHCGIRDPSWSELHHFVWFLNTQLQDYERNNFVSGAAAEDLPGFAKFVLRFLITMSRDFATRSLNMSEESPVLAMQYDGDEEEGDDTEDLQRFQMRRTWESSPHPYLFFNSDRMTFTFLGFNIDRQSGNLIDQQTGGILEKGIMAQNLYDALVRNHVPIQENFDRLPRGEKITKLCQVMGMDMPYDPDETYELTTDNVKKIMAIYMRFRCDIPVIIMGETGCGKTRLVKFMCALQVPPGANVTNMILMKVHGGTTNADIVKKVRAAEKIAKTNMQNFGDHMYTVLFFDEANTTESIGLIKEIMCDNTMEGERLELCQNLKIVAACNPYRKHSEELIKKLEQAGLGYHVDADKTTDRLGRVPMRRLVYRVQPLPQSMLPLVWDFGQLNTQTEDLYIRQMVRRYIREKNLPDVPGLVEVVSSVLTASQDFMREQEDECSFVSLRDVDRVLRVMSWFHEQSQDTRTLFNQMDMELYGDDEQNDLDIEDAEDIDEDEDEEQLPDDRENLSDLTRSLVLALGVCYHACLKERENYREHVVPQFLQPCQLPGGADQMLREIVCCQDVFLSNVRLEKNIARNMALKENVFMMVVCIELRIPLFLVGKPGSSKSLAKTIVSDAMQGNAAHETLFKELKQVQMVSFQCSPLSTPDGIVGTFRQCAKFQEDKDLTNFVSIVVLDEVGLAEDSPRMPLKTLHPLLEDGCQGDEIPQEYMKVAFIGISNWALDPAKMNRGILVQREVPDIEELKNSAEGICATDDTVKRLMTPLIEPMAKSYLKIFEEARKHREFFGLRDFYSLVKMVFSFVEKSKQPPTWFEMLHAIKRNFGGLDNVESESHFRKSLTGKVSMNDQQRPGDPECSPAALIEACLFDTNRTDSESRYLLLLTENYGALSILQQQIIAKQNEIRPVTIFGSSFPSDQEYTQVCRNINEIKVCMETGNTVVLLNLENLYESLYDALNQYYVYFGGERYVDLGLGTHRVKCRVHKQFRLIVVAEKQVVYDNFPIPLINRLEKHFLTINTMLTREQHKIVEGLEHWAEEFVKQKRYQYMQPREKQDYAVGDVFMGYHEDTCSAVALHVWRDFDGGDRQEFMKTVLSDAKKVLLWCATPDGVVRLQKSELPYEEQEQLQKCYFKEQRHDNLAEYLRYKLVEEGNRGLFAQVTTHSKLLSTSDREGISNATDIDVPNIMIETLQSFDTEQQFSNKIRSHLQKTETETTLLIVQCDSGNINGPLAACARYCVMDEYQQVRETMRFPFHVVFIIQLPRITGGCFTGFQCGIWHSAHIDDLRPAEEGSPTIEQMQTTSPGTLVQHAIDGLVPMETEETPVAEIYNRQQGEDITVYNNRFEEVPQAEEGMEWEGPDRTLAGPLSGMMGLRQEMVDLDDVVVHMEARLGHFESGPKINISAIVLSCVQTALSMVKDRDVDVQRTTKRVALVLELLQKPAEEGSPSFFLGISRLIAQLLQEKEKSHYRAENWLLEEAVKDDNVQKAGTFRRACLQVLESKIAPILAGIIAYLDTNHNLDILTQTESPWKLLIWLAMLNTPDALQLTYQYLQSPTRQSDLQEVVVMTTGCEGHIFSAQAPFSWLIYRQLEEILQTPQPDITDEEANETERKVQLFQRVFRESTLGKILATVDEYDTRPDITASYLTDYVHFVYHAKSEEEYALVCQSLEYLVTQMTASSEEDNSILQSLILVHQAYKILAPRLKYFQMMNSVWPECSSKIMDLKEKEPENEMFKEEEFTFSALCLLIDNLTPNKDELNDTMRRSNWLNKVHRYRPVVEKVMSLYSEDPRIFGAHSERSFTKAKCLWSRVLAVKLFLEHVCSKATEEKKITIKHCMPLFMMLGGDVDFKQLKAMNTVEKFLKQCNKTAVQAFMAIKETCCHCEKLMDEEAPIILPCKDTLCEHCLIDILEGDRKCPNCKRKIPRDFDRTKTKEKTSAEITQLRDYQKRCNSFFLDLVSQLCFAENSPPCDEVIDKLLGYIVCTLQSKKTGAGQKIQLTKELTIFDSGLDPNPVFRSYLLQLLMKTSGDSVEKNLQKYLGQAARLIHVGNVDSEKDYMELCLMIIQCLEDIFSQDPEQQYEILRASNRLHHAKAAIDSEEMSIDKLYAVANARCGLAVTAECIEKAVSQGINILTHQERRLIEAAQNLCLDTESKWPRIYLVKYLCRRYGVGTYQAVCGSQAPCLRWLKMQDLNREQVVEGPDRYVVCGPTYTSIREAVTKVVLGEDIQKLNGKLQESKTAQGHTEVMLTLAIYREITCASLYPLNKRRVTENVMTHVQECCEKRQGKLRDLTLAVLENKLGAYCKQLTVTEGEDLHHQGVQCILVHFLTVIQKLEGDRTLMQPLIGLTKNPQRYERSFIPTMPQDDLAEVKEALLAARRENPNENPVLYRCPNGHPYVIGNCGRPASLGRCKCGADIGGTGYKLVTGNILDTGVDTSETGHILGHADTRGQGVVQERLLSPVHCTCLRLLTHMAMFLGAANDPQAVVTIIKPDMMAQLIPEFLWNHVQADLNNLQRVLGCSIDDVFLVMHSIINNIMITHNQGDHIGDEMSLLTTKKGRERWEDRFSKTHLVPILQNVEQTVKEGTRQMGQDQRLGADPLLCLLYEIDTPQERIEANQLQNIPSVWRYRTHITIDHLRREFDSKIGTDKKGKSKLAVLKLFLQEEQYLRALKHVPSILKLQRALFQKYQRKLDKAEASTVTKDDIQRDEVAGEETAQLIADYAEAWDLIRKSIELYVCPTDLGGVTIPKEHCRRPITDKTPISVLLPTMKESGLCSFVLLDYLFRKQNDFLDRYMKATGRKQDSFNVVNPMDVTAAHLISYDPQQDILPMVLANCQYSFEIGKGTKIEYDFSSLERQLMDRFFYSKSRIHIERVMQIETMVYRTEFTNAAVFKKLEEKIQQEPLTAAVKHQISADIRSLPDLCQSLDNLDISISFLKSVGGPPEQNLHKFMSDTLKMENPLHSQKARQDCKFKHTQSLWLLLSFLRTKKMADHRQGKHSMFESVPEEFYSEIPEDLIDELDAYLRDMSIEKLGVFIEVLHEYIILFVSVKLSQDDEDYEDTTVRKLKDWLLGYLGEQEQPAMDVRVLTNFPDRVLYKHAVELWVKGYEMLLEKQGGRRR